MFFFFNDTATTEIYTLSLHDALPIWAIAIVLLAMAATRILGIILDGSPNLVMYIYLAAELLFASLALYLRSHAQDGNAT